MYEIQKSVWLTGLNKDKELWPRHAQFPGSDNEWEES